MRRLSHIYEHEPPTAEERQGKIRPYRQLISVISAFDKDIIQEISPYTARVIKPIVKLPMILVLCVSGMVAGISSTFFKFLGELIQDGGFTDSPLMTTMFLVVAIACSPALLGTLNWTMIYYDQLDVIPTYFAMIMIWTIMFGLIIMDEASEYTSGKLAGIAVATIVCIVGIMLQTKK